MWTRKLKERIINTHEHETQETLRKVENNDQQSSMEMTGHYFKRCYVLLQ